MLNDDTAGSSDTKTSTTSMVPSDAMSNAVGAERRPGVNVNQTTAPNNNASASGYALHTVVVNQLELVPEIGSTRNCQTTIVADTVKMHPSRSPSRR